MFAKLASNLTRKRVAPDFHTQSPPFFENVLNTYAVKE